MTLWAAKWVSDNALDGHREHIIYENLLPRLFKTRIACRAWITEKYGYIAERVDLQGEPWGWRVPQAVRVTVAVAAHAPKRRRNA